MSTDYNKGLADGVSLWAEACKRMPNCDECPIQQIAGLGVRCQDFISQFPAKAANLFKEMTEKDWTYFDEFVQRFPACSLGVEAVSAFCCRKAVFEGYLDCDKEGDACMECWKERYNGDVTEMTSLEE